MKTFRGATAAELIPFHLDDGDDLVPTLTRMAEELNLGAAALTMGAGALSAARLAPPGAAGPEPIGIVAEHTGPLSILAMHGWILANQPEIQLTLLRGAEVIAGRAVDGCTVRGTVEGLLLRLGNLRLARIADPETGAWTLATGAALRELPRFELHGQPIDLQAVLKVPPQLLQKHHVLPIALSGDTLLVATADPRNPFAHDALRQATGMRVQWVETPQEVLEPALEKVLQALQ